MHVLQRKEETKRTYSKTFFTPIKVAIGGLMIYKGTNLGPQRANREMSPCLGTNSLISQIWVLVRDIGVTMDVVLPLRKSS